MRVIPETLSYLTIQKRCGCLLFRARKSHFYLTLSPLEAPAQRKRRGYKEGKCNKCNRMQRPALALLCMLRQMFVLSS